MGLIKQVFFTVRKNIASFLLWVFLSAAGLAAGIYLMQTAERFCVKRKVKIGTEKLI